MSSRTRRRLRRLVLVVVLAVVGAGPGAQAKSSPYRATAVSGSWFVTGCVPTQAPSGSGFPLTLTARCIGEVTGGWTGYYVDDEYGTEDGTLSLRMSGVITLYAQASDGTCGSLRILTRTVTDGSTDALKSTATVAAGSGDWAGSRGSYKTTGQFDTAEGNGEYHGIWLRPRAASTGHASPCPPPTP